VTQALDLATWALAVFGAIWVVTSIISGMHRRAYNLAHAESGGSKKIQPDFLTVDKVKREAALARGAEYGAQLAQRERAASPVAGANVWSRIATVAAALIGLAFTAVGTFQQVDAADRAVRDLGNWEKLTTIVSQHQFGALLCVAVIASNAYLVARRLRQSGG
jgi:hypothetical protein